MEINFLCNGKIHLTSCYVTLKIENLNWIELWLLRRRRRNKTLQLWLLRRRLERGRRWKIDNQQTGGNFSIVRFQSRESEKTGFKIWFFCLSLCLALCFGKARFFKDFFFFQDKQWGRTGAWWWRGWSRKPPFPGLFLWDPQTENVAFLWTFICVFIVWTLFWTRTEVQKLVSSYKDTMKCDGYKSKMDRYRK